MPRGKKNPPPDGVIEVPLPLQGLDEQTALEYQPKGTSADLENVRASSPESGKVGLCQRSGIQKYCPDQLDGETIPVQEIHKVVVEDAQAQPWGIGMSYLPIGTDIYLLDTDGNVAAVFPAPNGMTAGPGIFDQHGNLMQQNTSTTAFRPQRHATRPQPDPMNFRRVGPFFSTARRARRQLFNPQPIPNPRLDGRQQVGGVNPNGQAAQRQENVGEDDGFQHIRDLDVFPPDPPPPQEWEGNADLPGGGS